MSNPGKVGIIAATAIGSCKTFESNHELIVQGHMEKVTPYMVINLSANTAAGEMAVMCGARGPHHFLQEACSAGSNAIGLGFRAIKYGEAEVMIVGGSDAGISPTLPGYKGHEDLTSSPPSSPLTGAVSLECLT